MIGDWILTISLFLFVGGAEVMAKNRAMDGKISRKRAVFEFTISFYVVLAIFVALSVIYRLLNGLPPQDILNKNPGYMIGFGLVATHLWVAIKLWQKLALGGVGEPRLNKAVQPSADAPAD